MSKLYDTDRDPVVCTSLVHIAGCLMRIQTTGSGAVLLNGALVEAFRSPTGAIHLAQLTDTPPLGSQADDTEFPDIPF